MVLYTFIVGWVDIFSVERIITTKNWTDNFQISEFSNFILPTNFDCYTAVMIRATLMSNSMLNLILRCSDIE